MHTHDAIFIVCNLIIDTKCRELNNIYGGEKIVF